MQTLTESVGKTTEDTEMLFIKWNPKRNVSDKKQLK